MFGEPWSFTSCVRNFFDWFSQAITYLAMRLSCTRFPCSPHLGHLYLSSTVTVKTGSHHRVFASCERTTGDACHSTHLEVFWVFYEFVSFCHVYGQKSFSTLQNHHLALWRLDTRWGHSGWSPDFMLWDWWLGVCLLASQKSSWLLHQHFASVPELRPVIRFRYSLPLSEGR